jgi:hypothetical protein
MGTTGLKILGMDRIGREIVVSLHYLAGVALR